MEIEVNTPKIVQGDIFHKVQLADNIPDPLKIRLFFSANVEPIYPRPEEIQQLDDLAIEAFYMIAYYKEDEEWEEMIRKKFPSLGNDEAVERGNRILDFLMNNANFWGCIEHKVIIFSRKHKTPEPPFQRLLLIALMKLCDHDSCKISHEMQYLLLRNVEENLEIPSYLVDTFFDVIVELRTVLFISSVDSDKEILLHSKINGPESKFLHQKLRARYNVYRT